MRFRMRCVVVLALVPAALAALGGCESTGSGEGAAWPAICCRTAGQMLNEIEAKAIAAKGTTPPPHVLLDRVILAVQKCRANVPPSPYPPAEHCGFVERALAAAVLYDWERCATELEHGH